MSELKQFFLEELRNTKREGVEDLIIWLEHNDFFNAPASSKYHGCYPGGLLEHSLNVLECLRFEYDNLKSTDFNIPEISEDSLTLCALLHDVCKVNMYVESTRNVKDPDTGKWEQVPYYKREPVFPMGHGGKSVFILQQFMTLTAEEAQAIFWHMSAYDISNYMTLNELGQAYEMNLLAFLLNAADMKATYICENKNYQTKS